MGSSRHIKGRGISVRGGGFFWILNFQRRTLDSSPLIIKEFSQALCGGKLLLARYLDFLQKLSDQKHISLEVAAISNDLSFKLCTNILLPAGRITVHAAASELVFVLGHIYLVIIQNMPIVNNFVSENHAIDAVVSALVAVGRCMDMFLLKACNQKAESGSKMCHLQSGTKFKQLGPQSLKATNAIGTAMAPLNTIYLKLMDLAINPKLSSSG
ncbi:hypothetical protein VNO77_14508 [Canavalia gladiata]|uniref:Uncharacterized protein n=1 Tax=Canavalia gladiata TaxID=3824 RepID=A0AAN9M2R7_CANGL